MKPGQRLGPYVIVRELGRGSMGVVYEGEHQELGHRHAIKVLPREVLGNRAAVRRFEIEMESLVHVEGHPGVVRVHSAGRTPQGAPYFAMEYVEGRSLRQALKEGLPRDEALRVVLEVAQALAHAHAKQLIHRDVKPDNIMLGVDGVVRLTDFGLARFLLSSERLTKSHDLVGTPFYLAPEQAKRSLGDIGPWSDVYSLGVLIYEILVGEPPHTGKTTADVTAKVVKAPVVPPSLRVEGVSPHVEAVCLRALGRRPEDRYPDAGALADALVEALERATISAERPSAPRPRSRAVVLLSVVAGASLLLAGAAVVLQVRRDRALAEEARALGDRVSSLRRRLQPDADPRALLGEAAALEAGVAAAGDHADLDDVRGRAAALVGEVRAAAAQAAWREGDVAAARAALGEAPEAVPTFPERCWILLLAGDAAAALAGGGLPPLARAHAAAWAGDEPACRAALADLDPGPARATALQLAPFLPALAADAGDPASPLGAEWDAVVRGRRALAEGLPPAAAIAFEEALPGGPAPELDAAARRGLAAVALARGDLPRAAGLLIAAAGVAGADASPASWPTLEEAAELSVGLPEGLRLPS